MKQECKDCNKSLEHCTCIEDTVDFPKQEPKKVLTEEDIFNQRDIDAVTDYINRETSKQETLEEFAERYTENWFENGDKSIELVIAGAKWQQEQIGKSEFLQRLRGTLSDAEARRLIFETFKNR